MKSKGSTALQKTYDDAYLTCSTAVYFESQGNEEEALRSWRNGLRQIQKDNARRTIRQPYSETDKTLIESLKTMELQCMERVDVIEALRMSRLEEERNRDMIREWNGGDPPPLPTRPDIPPAYSQLTPVPPRPPHDPTISLASSSSISLLGANLQPNLAVKTKNKSSRTPSPEKKGFLSTLRKNSSSSVVSTGKRPLLEVNPRIEAATASRAAARAWSSTSAVSNAGRSFQDSSTATLQTLGSRGSAANSMLDLSYGSGGPSASNQSISGRVSPPSSIYSNRSNMNGGRSRLAPQYTPRSSTEYNQLPYPDPKNYQVSSFDDEPHSPYNGERRRSSNSWIHNPNTSHDNDPYQYQDMYNHLPEGHEPPPVPRHDVWDTPRIVHQPPPSTSPPHFPPPLPPALPEKPANLRKPPVPTNQSRQNDSSYSQESKPLHVSRPPIPSVTSNTALPSPRVRKDPTTSSRSPRTSNVNSNTNAAIPSRKPIAATTKKEAPTNTKESKKTSTAPKAKIPIENSETPADKPKEEEEEESEWTKRVKRAVKNMDKGVDEAAVKQVINEIVEKGDTVHWDDIAGLDTAKQALKEAVVYPFLRPDLFSGLREPARGMLLFGPPGTGKTMLARAVATESRSTFFSISASSLTSKYLGESEKLVRALFALAKALAPSIIFVDEIDSLLSSRSGSGEHEATRRIKTEFLIQWSDLQRAAAGREVKPGEGDATRVLVLAATNLPWAIDEAARRRFVRRQYIPLPEGPTRIKHLKTLLGYQMHDLGEEDLHRLEELTEGFSGSDMTALAKDAAMGPLRSVGEALLYMNRDEIRPISFQDFEDSLRNIRPSVGKEGLAEYDNWAKQYGERV